MKRRDFLRKSIPAGVVLPSLLNGFSLKVFGEDLPFGEAMLPQMMNNDHVLVIVQLNGGNDGLNMVVPLENFSSYVNARPNIYIPENKVLSLTGTKKAGFHPVMTGMQKMYNDGLIKVVQSVGYPQPNFSHFRATDIWMSGSDSNQYVNSGWAGRYLNYEYPNYPVGYPNASMTDPLAIQIGSVTSLALQGPSATMGMSISNPANFYNLVNGNADPVPNTPAGKELSYIRTVSQQTQQYAALIRDASLRVPLQSTYPANNTLGDQLKIVARLIKGGLKTKIYMVTMGGFDTHSVQVNTTDTTTGNHAVLLQRVSDAIKAFQDDLKYLGIEKRVIGMTFSEFGRRIKSNGSAGTDHGAAAPLVIFGTNVTPGILGNTPTLPANATVNDNIPFQYDFRSVYATLLANWLCVDATALNTIMLKNYQTLPLINARACNAALPNLTDDVLISNYPNPFTSSTIINFRTSGGHTLVQIIDSSGRVIRNLVDEEYPPGSYTVPFDSGALASGVYYARLQNLATQQVRPMLKVRG